MLCFPQVLFAGAVVPVAHMAAPGRWLSLSLANRYSFEPLGRALGLDRFTGPLPAMRPYGDTFPGTAPYRCLGLAGFPRGSPLPPALVLPAGPCPAGADGDEAGQRRGTQAGGRAPGGPRRGGGAGRRAAARRVRTASPPRPGGDQRWRGLPRPARGMPAPRRPLPATPCLARSPPTSGPG